MTEKAKRKIEKQLTFTKFQNSAIQMACEFAYQQGRLDEKTETAKRLSQEVSRFYVNN